MMFAYDFDAMSTFLDRILKESLPGESYRWLRETGTAVRSGNDISKFNIAFVAMPRKTGKGAIKISAAEESEVEKIRKGFTLRQWTVDRLARVWLLMQLDPADKAKYVATIENLFLSAEMSELVALYSALPVLAYPESWSKRCAEGIRSNIGQVLEAIICDNPYPAEHLDEAAWNQLVLKAIFTEKPILSISGLRERRNEKLARSLSDYAHERWAAHREINPLQWICVAPFIDSGNFSDIQRVFESDDDREKKAAALACYESTFPPAKQLLEHEPDLKNRIGRGDVTWQSVV